LIVVVPESVNLAGTLFVIVNEFAVTFPSIETVLVPAVDEIRRGPSRVVPPTAPVNVTAPVEPEFKVSS